MRDNPSTYGELVVLGTDGELPGGNKGRRRSRFQVGESADIFFAFSIWKYVLFGYSNVTQK